MRAMWFVRLSKKIFANGYLRITDYAEKLLDGLDTLEWPEKVKTHAAQLDW